MLPIIRITIFLFSLGCLLPQSVSANPPDKLKVVVTIKPLHSLVAALMQGITEPQLLLDTTQSVHHSHLRPSDYRKLADADIVFWAGTALETFIPTLAKKYQDHVSFISLMQIKGITLLPVRGKQGTSHRSSTDPDADDIRFIDPHFWLSPDNARQVVIGVSQELIAHDRSNESGYLLNRAQTLKRIDQLAKRLDDELDNTRTPFITYHDAYQYFEKEYRLNRVASVNLNEETTPGIRQIRSIKWMITERKIPCLFFEAPTRPAIIDTLLDHSEIQAVELDALGFNLKAGPELWFELLDRIGNKMARCLRQ